MRTFLFRTTFVLGCSLLLFIVLVVIGCSQISQTLDTTTQYRKDVSFLVNGKRINGVGVVPRAESYSILIDYKRGNLDLLTLTTCHRQIPIENEEHKFAYLFTPGVLETDDNCPLDIGVYDKKGRHGWGYLLFERPDANLVARLDCNGESTVYTGISICQAHVDSAQRIRFNIPVRAVSDELSPQCLFTPIDAPKGDLHREFEISPAKGLCDYHFGDGDGHYHYLTVYGYETIILRE